MTNQQETQYLNTVNALHLMGGGTSPDVPTSFTLSESQIQEITEWQRNQIQREDPYMGPIGSRFIFKFTVTNLGEGVIVEDSVTGESEDFTEYDLW